MKTIKLKSPVQNLKCTIHSEFNHVRLYSSVYDLPYVSLPGSFVVTMEKHLCGKHISSSDDFPTFRSDYISRSCYQCINSLGFNAEYTDKS
jgi:hypothetical protein